MSSAPTTPPALVPSSSGAFFAAQMDMEASLSATMLPPPTMRAPSTSPSAMPAARSTSTTFDPGAMAEVADVDHGEHLSIILSPTSPAAGMTSLPFFSPLADAAAMLGIVAPDHAVPLDLGFAAPAAVDGLLPFQEADSLTVPVDDAFMAMFDVSAADLMTLLADAGAVAAPEPVPACDAPATAAPVAAAAAPEPAPVPVLVPAAVAKTVAKAAASSDASSSPSSSSGSASPPPARRSSRQTPARRAASTSASTSTSSTASTASTAATPSTPARARRPAAVSSAEEMYRIHRDRNNEAARISRQRRRNREDNLQRENQVLADENVQLRARVGEQDRLIAHLQQMLAERMR